MADNIIQKRTYELDEYIQELPGDPAYEDPGTVWIPLDRNSWPEAKKFALSSFLSTAHMERGPASVTSVNVVVTYDTAFSVSNYYLEVKAYRTVGGVIENIPITVFNRTLSGFTLTLYDYIAGDTVDFFGFE